MKARTQSRLRPRRATAGIAPPWATVDAAYGDAPLRAELLSADQMERHGRSLAETHAWELSRAPDRLLPRLADNRRTLAAVCKLLCEGEGPRRRSNSAATFCGVSPMPMPRPVGTAGSDGPTLAPFRS